MDLINASNELNEKLEKRILEFFGSVEAFNQFAYLYVIEITPPTLTKEDTDSLSAVYSIEQKVRLRLKTDEELKEEEDDGGII